MGTFKARYSLHLSGLAVIWYLKGAVAKARKTCSYIVTNSSSLLFQIIQTMCKISEGECESIIVFFFSRFWAKNKEVFPTQWREEKRRKPFPATTTARRSRAWLYIHFKCTPGTIHVLFLKKKKNPFIYFYILFCKISWFSSNIKLIYLRKFESF